MDCNVTNWGYKAVWGLGCPGCSLKVCSRVADDWLRMKLTVLIGEYLMKKE